MIALMSNLPWSPCIGRQLAELRHILPPRRAPRSTPPISSKAEILYGIDELPEGRRRLALAAAAEAMFADDFAGRVLPFEEAAAVHYAEIVAARRHEGRPIEAFDAQIAATALVAAAGLATRDTGDFAGCGLNLINPWEVP